MISFRKYLVQTYKINKGFSNLSVFKHKKVYDEWVGQIKTSKSPLELELPWITVIAKNYIVGYLNNKMKAQVKVFEYGSGGSSIFFLNYAAEVVSVEHSAEWYELVRNCIEQKKIHGWSGQLIPPEVIDCKQSGKLDAANPLHYYSTDENFLLSTFKNYASHIDQYPDLYFDIVLVDGRSRPSCIFHSLNKIKKGGLLILDNAEREYYLSQNPISDKNYSLDVCANGALISFDGFTQTNIYRKLEQPAIGTINFQK